jgi:hypothetical protein
MKRRERKIHPPSKMKGRGRCLSCIFAFHHILEKSGLCGLANGFCFAVCGISASMLCMCKTIWKTQSKEIDVRLNVTRHFETIRAVWKGFRYFFMIVFPTLFSLESFRIFFRVRCWNYKTKRACERSQRGAINAKFIESRRDLGSRCT